MSKDRTTRDWYRPLARDFQCSQHNKTPKALVKAVSEHTGLSQVGAAHVLEKLRHLKYCLGESEMLTLFRLQQGANQTPKKQEDWNDPE